MLDLVRGLTSKSRDERSAACGTITDWVTAFDQFQVRLLAMTLSTIAVVESDPGCREDELHALGEISDTGLFGMQFFEPIKSLDRRELGVSEREYIDALMEIGDC